MFHTVINLLFYLIYRMKKIINNQEFNVVKKDLGIELNNIVYFSQESYEFMLWLIGFTDGEGTFSVEINKNASMTTGYQVQIAYIITQHGRDLELLEKIKKYFNNSGEIALNRGKTGGNVYNYRLRNITIIKNLIIPLFSNYPLKTQKNLNFQDFKKVAELMENKEHLTIEGIEKIRKIKEGMNRGRNNIN
jgi:hypothetical protein